MKKICWDVYLYSIPTIAKDKDPLIFRSEIYADRWDEQELIQPLSDAYPEQDWKLLFHTTAGEIASNVEPETEAADLQYDSGTWSKLPVPYSAQIALAMDSFRGQGWIRLSLLKAEENRESSEKPLLYAILSGARLLNLQERLETSNLQFASLFSDAANEKMREIGPYLVRLDPENRFSRKILDIFTTAQREARSDMATQDDSGIIIGADADFDTVRHHFRKFTRIRNHDGSWRFLLFWSAPFLLSLCQDRDFAGRFLSIDGRRISVTGVTGRVPYRISLVENIANQGKELRLPQAVHNRMTQLTIYKRKISIRLKVIKHYARHFDHAPTETWNLSGRYLEYFMKHGIKREAYLIPLIAISIADKGRLANSEEGRIAKAILESDLDQDRKYYEMTFVLRNLQSQMGVS